jgi:hypothetical protein
MGDIWWTMTFESARWKWPQTQTSLPWQDEIRLYNLNE